MGLENRGWPMRASCNQRVGGRINASRRGIVSVPRCAQAEDPSDPEQKPATAHYGPPPHRLTQSRQGG